LSAVEADGESDAAPLTSPDGMSPTTLRDRVRAELIAQDLTWTALQKRARVSQKTIDALKNGDAKHQWGHTTLSKIDAALGLPAGTLYGVWESDDSRASASDVAEIAAQMHLLQAKLAELSERPPWYAEALEALGALDPAVRYRLIDLARELGRR